MTRSPLVRSRRVRASACAVAATAITAGVLAGCGSSSPHKTSATKTASTGFTSQVFASGVPIQHDVLGAKTSINQPDDITQLGSHIFVAFQNNVGPQGEPTPKGSQGTGNKNSTVVEFSSSGSAVAQWDIPGHADGLTADTANKQVIATVNEDANPILYVITPGNSQPVTYHFPALPSHGGVDALSFYNGTMVVSASAPGTSGGKAPPQASYPAVYSVTLDSSTHTANVRPLFGDEASATSANSGASGSKPLALTDPDSNFVVPSYAQRFGGDFELTSQGDYNQIFTANPGGSQLSVLKTSQSIDDSAWSPGPSSTLYVTDGSADLIYKVTGPFTKGSEIVGVTPCDAGNAPASCPSPAFPNPYLGQINQSTGAVSKLTLTGATIQPAGLLFVP